MDKPLLKELQKDPPKEKEIATVYTGPRETTASTLNPTIRTVLAFEETQIQGKDPEYDGFVRHAITTLNQFRVKSCKNSEDKFMGFDTVRPELGFQIYFKPYCGYKPRFFDEALATKAPANIREFIETHRELSRFGLDILLRNHTNMLDLDGAIHDAANRARRNTAQFNQRQRNGDNHVVEQEKLLRDLGVNYLANTLQAPNRPVVIDVIEDEKLTTLLRHQEFCDGRSTEEVRFSSLTIKQDPFEFDAYQIIHKNLPEAGHFIIPYPKDLERKKQVQEAVAFLMLENIARRHTVGPAQAEFESRDININDLGKHLRTGLQHVRYRILKEQKEAERARLEKERSHAEGNVDDLCLDEDTLAAIEDDEGTATPPLEPTLVEDPTIPKTQFEAPPIAPPTTPTSTLLETRYDLPAVQESDRPVEIEAAQEIKPPPKKKRGTDTQINIKPASRLTSRRFKFEDSDN